MKINCGPTFEERRDAKRQWHAWYAWHPVRIDSNDCRWLETIQRRQRGNYYIHYEYRLIPELK